YTVTVYHTQEKRHQVLVFPKLCVRADAWLGEAYYFWKEEMDADDWGNNSKRRTNYYEVYECTLNSDNYLDTVCNEEHYYYGYGSGTRTPRHWSAGVASPKQPSHKVHRMIFSYRNGPRKDRNGEKILMKTWYYNRISCDIRERSRGTFSLTPVG